MAAVLSRASVDFVMIKVGIGRGEAEGRANEVAIPLYLFGLFFPLNNAQSINH